MIEINSKKKLKQTDELERASENLPSNLIIQIYRNAEPSMVYDRHDVNAIFIPYSKNQLTSSKEIIFYNNEVNWAKFDSGRYGYAFNYCSDFEQEPINEVAFLYTTKVPKKYDYIDLYIQSREQENTLRSCSVEFIDNDKKKTLFSYTFEQKEMFANLSCGTFARVSNGWKFYPKFEVPNNVILQLNLSKQKGKS